MDYSPKSLPKIDEVEIVSLKNIDADRASEYMKEAYDAPFVKIDDELAQQISELWRKLPTDGQMRCHIPPFGLRFFQHGNLILQGSICWECNNIYGDEKGVSFSYEFNANHQISQKLLAICKDSFNNL